MRVQSLEATQLELLSCDFDSYFLLSLQNVDSALLTLVRLHETRGMVLQARDSAATSTQYLVSDFTAEYLLNDGSDGLISISNCLQNITISDFQVLNSTFERPFLVASQFGTLILTSISMRSEQDALRITMNEVLITIQSGKSFTMNSCVVEGMNALNNLLLLIN